MHGTTLISSSHLLTGLSPQDTEEYAKSLTTVYWSKIAFSFSSLIRSGQHVAFELPDAYELFKNVFQGRAAFLVVV